MQQAENSPRQGAAVGIDDIITLFRLSTQHQYNARELDTTNATIELNVTSLFGQDFEYQLITNRNGELSLYYPRRILIPIIDKWSNIKTPKLNPNVDIRDYFVRSRIARCRSRFVSPAILIDGKFICRSATVASWGEVYSRSGVDRFLDSGTRVANPTMLDTSTTVPVMVTDLDGPPTIAIEGAAAAAATANVEPPQQRNIFDKLRGADIELLKMLDVKSIVNLMVERKKTMFGVNVTSSENSDKENRYRDFQLLILPYPGCEHFREFSIQKYDGTAMFYDWSLPLNDASFNVSSRISSLVSTDWNFWKSWSSLDLTKNYFRLIIRHLETDEHGLLIHCISGWDRTPLFISLLRISLWADGWIHQSLTVEEILYLTLAYDWYLFGHCLPERLLRGEEILFFAFMILPHLASEEFSYKRSKNATTISESIPVPTRPKSVYSISALSHLNHSDSPSPVDINDDASINYHRTTEDVSGDSYQNGSSTDNNDQDDSRPKTIREEKLLDLSRLFHMCYRTVIPNPPPVIASTTSTFPPVWGALNPRPIGREIARSINNFLGQWRTQPR